MVLTQDPGALPKDPPPPMKRLAGRIALITGATRGIGHAVTRHYAAEGAQVIALGRTRPALEALDDTIRREGGLPPVLIHEDVTKVKRIAAMGAALHERFGRLDVLVGNAAMLGELSPIAHHDPTMWERILDTNLTANFNLVQALHPLLMKSEAGRVIFVTSGITRNPQAYWGAYAISKAGLEMMMRLYAKEVEQTPIRVNCIDPGCVATRMRALAFPGEDPTKLPKPEDVTDPFIHCAMPDWQGNGEILTCP